jgi:tRNA 2-thiouridine synthesizing protein D
MLVCVTSALRRGVVDSETATQEGLSQHNLAVPFQQVGLGEFFTRLHSVDNLVQL